MDCPPWNAGRKPAAGDDRPEQTEVFADFEGGDYGDWKVEGEAFGDAPASGGRTIQELSGFKGKGLVNSWTGSDKLQGKLISPEFKIEKPFINFLIGGGRDEKTLNISLWVDGKKVRSAAGKQSDAMAWASWNVAELVGKQAHIEILDASSRGWGHIDVDHIVFSTKPPGQGSGMCLSNGPRISGPSRWDCWGKKSRTSWISGAPSRARPVFLPRSNQTRKRTRFTNDLSASGDLPPSGAL